MILRKYLTDCQIDWMGSGRKVSVGQYNEPRGHVQFISVGVPGPLVIGDCNRFEDGVRVFVGPGGVRIGDYNVFHRNVTIIGGGEFSMGHNGWVGEDSWLDCTGGLTIGNGVTVGLGCHVWSHLARGEQIEGWLIIKRPTVLGDDVWLVGDGIHVASGVIMGKRSIALAGASVTYNTEMDGVYAGVPAKQITYSPHHEVSLGQKWDMMWQWAKEFDSAARRYDDYIQIKSDLFLFLHYDARRVDDNVTSFFLADKTYTKRLTSLEREFVAFLRDDHKARFTPA